MQHVTPNSPPDKANLARNAAQMPPNLHLFGLPTPEPTPLYCADIQPLNPQKCRRVGFFGEKFLGAKIAPKGQKSTGRGEVPATESSVNN